jgi:hypothetical protein
VVSASCTDRSEATQSGSLVIHSLTLVSAAAAPAAPKRTRSRSVRIPIGRSPSTTTTDPTPWSTMRALAAATVSEEAAVMAGLLITSATVVIDGEGGMPRILPTR